MNLSSSALRALLFQGVSAQALAQRGLTFDGDPRLFHALVKAIGAIQ